MAITRRGVLVSGRAIAALSTLSVPAGPQTASPAADVAKSDGSAEPVCLTDFEPLAKNEDGTDGVGVHECRCRG